jgi:hypothetical protein
LANNIIVNNFGINPVKGGSPAKDTSRTEIDSCVVGEIMVIFLNCLDVIRFAIFISINKGIIKEQ